MKIKKESYLKMYYKDLIKKIEKQDLKNFDYLIKYYFKKEKLNKIEIIKLKYLLKKSRKFPIQYIVGNVDFYGYIYKVNKNVLIPRFETEQLVENVIKLIGNKKVSILDIGTGSGCIGITLKRELNAKVTLLDISKKALKVAKANAKDLDINIIQSNLFSKVQEKYDVIVSNPPYIRYNEKIMDIVSKNEPKIALYAKDNGMYYYDEILKNCSKYLNKNFLIAFEIGEKQKEDVIKLVNKYLNNIDIICKKDYSNKDRMIFIMNKK